MIRKIACTLQLMIFALLPPDKSAPPVMRTNGGGERSCAPAAMRGGMERLVDDRGEIRVLFAHCLAPAAPFVLFRLKRHGFSRCTVRVSERGLHVEARR